jgi:hypothetical protein
MNGGSTIVLSDPNGNATDNPDVRISSIRLPDGSTAWQLDFEDLKWSLPGATPIQFGVLAEPYTGYTWYKLAAPSHASGNLRVFSSAGRLQSTFQPASPGSIDVQAWGHLLARISIRSSGQLLKVVLHSLPYLAVDQVDKASPRFGPRNAPPDSVQLEDVDHKGKSDMVLYFRVAEIGLDPKSINGCLTGKRQDGAPFEGCDLLNH